jgi:energy-coupling factor transporter ATP-binding protein EcfA2
MHTSGRGPDLVKVLRELRGSLQSTRLFLEIQEVENARALRDEAIGQIEDYLVPRLEELEAPILAVVGGSTGAGKSTLINSLVGTVVSPAGVLRPTTRAPVLICSEQDLPWFSDDRVLPAFARTSGALDPDGRSLHLIPIPHLPAGLALLDAPDIDSVVRSNRELATQLLAAADLWLFVTTAARYSDAVPWEFLKKAERRSTALAVVLNRVPPDAVKIVVGHLSSMLEAQGLARAPVFSISELPLSDGLIPRAQIEEIRGWLERLTADSEARAQVIRMTLEGALGDVIVTAEELAASIDAQSATAYALGAEVRRAYGTAQQQIAEGLNDGRMLRSEVLARWQDVVGTGDLMRTIESRIGWVRDRFMEALTGKASVATEVKVVLENSIEALVVASSDGAAELVVKSWRASPGGRALLESSDEALDRSSHGLRKRTEDLVREWQGYVLELVAAEGATKRAVGRALSLGVNGIGVALMITVFAHTGGLSGGELVVASGTAAVSQKLLEAIFGDQAVRDLAARARADLLQRVGGLLDAEANRFHRLLDPVAPAPGEAQAVRTAALSLRMARQ